MNKKITVREAAYDAVIVGSGIAGYQCADELLRGGMKNIALYTENRLFGTSRNTGSDKQTYYKMSLAGDEGDSVLLTAKTLYDGGGMDGDIALSLAACSVECFLKLALLGVDFPKNEYGEYVGYRTDHDPFCRASSVGPYTSKRMTEALEKSALARGLYVCENRRVVRLLVSENKLVGLLALCTDESESESENGIVLETIKTPRVLLATGGPAGMYADSVYPTSQSGGSSLALTAGAEFSNLCEGQFGLASTDFRWNVSGSYQQVLPRYISVDENGVEREFLREHFESDSEMLKRIFKKGYEWPFDRRKSGGSSKIDLLVYRESVTLGRRVYLDFRRNPSGLENGFSAAGEEAEEYLRNSDALRATPIARLYAMNPGAAQLYLEHGIDLQKVPLRIAVCAQHCNGGIHTDANWETSVSGLYAAGEAAGSFGMFRPGGSALNDCMVGGLRAAQKMLRREEKISDAAFCDAAERAIFDLSFLFDRLFSENAREKALSEALLRARRRMSRAFGFLRDLSEMKKARGEIEEDIAALSELRIANERALSLYFKLEDTLKTQLATAHSMIFCAERFGARGASYVCDGAFENELLPRGGEDQKILLKEENGSFSVCAVPTKPIPSRNLWFESVWKSYRESRIENDKNKEEKSE